MHVVATAGHVDHGKSTLVRALTGQEPDRLEQERRRGLSIELGYCWTTIEPVGEVAFVDVPGHERFVATTLAGLGPVPVALVVVAADDPWMPQAEEHVVALDALGVRHGVLVVTRSDLADPEPVRVAARERLAATSLRGLPEVVVSGRTGAGLDELRRTLGTVLAAVPPPDADADVRLWIDRRFHVRGSGAVVTGTLAAGTARVGDVLVAPDGRRVRVRSLESLDVPRPRVGAVARVALNLTGDGVAGLRRGDPLCTPGAYGATDLVDVDLVTGPSTQLPREPVVHLGAALVGAQARPLGEPDLALARLRLERPLPLRPGDRLLLRDPGSRTVWGAEVLDPRPPGLPRRGAAADRAAALTRHLVGRPRDPAAQLALRGVLTDAELRVLGLPKDGLDATALRAGSCWIDAGHLPALRERLVGLVAEADVAGSGLTPAAAARDLGLPDAAAAAAVVEAPLRVEAGRITARAAGPSAAARDALAALERHVAGAPFAAPEAGQLVALGLVPAVVAELERAGAVIAVSGVVLPASAAAVAVDLLAGLEQPFTAGRARQALGTSRRVALPLLDHLDRTGRTVRLPDDRRRVGRRA